MVNVRRWYDTDPLLAMMVTILENTSYGDQVEIVRQVLYKLDTLNQYGQKTVNLYTVFPIFPRQKRKNLVEGALRLLEIIKKLPPALQQEVALDILLLPSTHTSTWLLSPHFLNQARTHLQPMSLPPFKNLSTGTLPTGECLPGLT